MMRRMMLLFAMGTLLTAACAPSTVETGEYKATMVMLPDGKPDAGREAFVTLGCAACHAVAWDADLPAPVHPNPGPELGLDPTKLGPGGLATSIVAPSHKVAAKYRRGEGDLSPMADYTGLMTVRQLSDIVSYLERQGLETKARTGG